MSEVKILSGGAANGLVNAIRAEFLTATGHNIVGDFGAVGGMFDRIVGGEAVDIVVLSQKLMDALSDKGLIDGRSMTPIGKVVTGLAVRSNQAKPVVVAADDLKEAFLSSDAIYIPDHVKSTAGIHIAAVLEKLGIFETVQPRLMSFPNGQTAMAAMAKSEHTRPIGCTQMTEILNTNGVEYVGNLPAGLDLTTTYTAAVSASSTNPSIVQQLIGILSAPNNEATRLQAGFLP
ncbi:MAG: substrate-binding domain-containing protein [Quisquiliibacterium sp.]